MLPFFTKIILITTGNMKITINNKEIELRYTFRSMMIYEKITGKTFNPVGLSEIMIYFYSTLLASDKDCTVSFDEFIDLTDAQPNLLTEFSQWLNSVLSKNAFINGNTDEKTETPKTEEEPKKG